jgi:hypothetical protein
LIGTVFRAADAKLNRIDEGVGKGKAKRKAEKRSKNKARGGKNKARSGLLKSKRELRYAIILRLLYEVYS